MSAPGPKRRFAAAQLHVGNGSTNRTLGGRGRTGAFDPKLPFGSGAVLQRTDSIDARERKYVDFISSIL
jgi:hypothetical protein